MSCGARFWESLVRRWKKLPPSLICMYFLIGWSESFPLTAMTALLYNELHLPLSVITTYWAVAYLPWQWKPLFGWISDTFPIGRYHRSPYIFIAAVGSALGYILIAAVGKASWSIFVIGTGQAVFTAFLQLMVDAFLVDIARQELNQAAACQSVANSSKWVGTLVAQVCALVVYARGAGGSLVMDGAWLTARQAIALTAVAPFIFMIMAPFAPETADMDFNRPCSCSTIATVKVNGDSVRFAFSVILVQADLVIVGCKSFFSETAQWWSALLVSLAVTILLAFLVLCLPRLRQLRRLQASPGGDANCRWIRTALFCFLVNAIPTSGVSVNLLQFDVLKEDTYQTIGIISSCTSVIAALAFGGCFNEWSPQWAIGASALVSILAGFSRLPFAYLAIDYLSGHEQKSASMLSSIGVWAVSASVLDSISSIFAVLPIDTLVTTASGLEGRNKSSTALAIFLSIYSFGATVGGLLSASLLQALGLDGKNWKPLPTWIIATASAKLLVLLVLPILPQFVPSQTRPELDASNIDTRVSLSMQGSQDRVLLASEYPDDSNHSA